MGNFRLSIICAVAGHKASEKTIWNQGTHFSKCARCRLDLVQLQGRWEPPPPWFKVVWRPRPAPAEAVPPEAPLELIAQAVSVAPSQEERSGTDRRVAVNDAVLAALQVDRRRGGQRRKPMKRQAISRD